MQYREQLELLLSRDRLAAYATPSNNDLDTITTYFWNIALCQALYPSLGTLEVAVRNTIHTTLSIHFDRTEWYDTPGVLQRRERDQIAKAKAKIRAANKQPVPGRVIASLTFGFWTSLLDALYGNSPNGPQIWRSPNGQLLMDAFPHAPKHALGVRRPTFNRLDDIRLLRNRVFHYERIYHGIVLPGRGRHAPLRHVSIAQMHTDVIDMIGWVDSTLAATVSHLDTFGDVETVGLADIERRIKGFLNIP